MQEFTLEQIGMQVTALQNFFDQVTLIDPLAQAEVDPATLQATGHADAVPVLNADGRGWQRFWVRIPVLCFTRTSRWSTARLCWLPPISLRQICRQ